MTTASELTASATNTAAQAAMTALIRDERAVLFAGAGVSVPAGYPTWLELLQGLEGVCRPLCGGLPLSTNPAKAIKHADAIKAHIRQCTGDLGRYIAHLVNVFGKTPNIEPFHRELVALPFRGFVTTNYDSTLEAALAPTEPQPPDKTVVVTGGHGSFVRAFHASLTRSNGARMVAHIHGHVREPHSIVLSEGDYNNAYGLGATASGPPAFTQPPLVEFLQTVLAVWSLVFVGFSFRDPNLDVFLEAASKRYGLWNTSTHYALIPTTDTTADDDRTSAERLRVEFGIETVFYEQLGSSHERLREIVSVTCVACGVQPPDINARTIVGMTE